MAATLAQQELPNLVALLSRMDVQGDATATIELCGALYAFLNTLHCPRALQQVALAREAASERLALAPWSHARFGAERHRVEQLPAQGQIGLALAAAQSLHQQALAAGDSAYDGADYDAAVACFLVGRMSIFAGLAETALSLLQEAERRFGAVEHRRPGCGAADMARASITEQADALCGLNRLDEAASAYEKSMGLAKNAGSERDLAVCMFQLGTVRMFQGRLDEAWAAFDGARQTFAQLGEPTSVAAAWHQMGMVHHRRGEGEPAERAYRQSLAITVQLREVTGQAATLNQLGGLYDDVLQQPEQAVVHSRQALQRYEALNDVLHQGMTNNNLASTLRKLGRLDEARDAIEKAQACHSGLGHDAEPWKTWAVLADIEADAENMAAALAARQQAITAFAAFRRDGGENHNGRARLVTDVGQLLLNDETERAGALVEKLAKTPEGPRALVALLSALQAVVAGARAASLADAPELDYADAVELQLLLERLSAAGK